MGKNLWNSKIPTPKHVIIKMSKITSEGIKSSVSFLVETLRARKEGHIVFKVMRE